MQNRTGFREGQEGNIQYGSPNKAIDRTFIIAFRFPRKSRSLFLTKESRYRNPIILAKELDECLCRGEFTSKADMAKSLGYSRARITQLLSLLSLSDQVLEQIRASGDYLGQAASHRKNAQSIAGPARGRTNL